MTMPGAKRASDWGVGAVTAAEVESYDFSPEEAYCDLGATDAVPEMVFHGNLRDEERAKTAAIDKQLRSSAVGHNYVQANPAGLTAEKLIPMDPKFTRSSAIGKGDAARRGNFIFS